jgi:hypothetical protein
VIPIPAPEDIKQVQEEQDDEQDQEQKKEQEQEQEHELEEEQGQEQEQGDELGGEQEQDQEHEQENGGEFELVDIKANVDFVTALVNESLAATYVVAHSESDDGGDGDDGDDGGDDIKSHLEIIAMASLALPSGDLHSTLTQGRHTRKHTKLGN